MHGLDEEYLNIVRQLNETSTELKHTQEQLEIWKANYYKLADAISNETHSPERLVNIARATRQELCEQ